MFTLTWRTISLNIRNKRPLQVHNFNFDKPARIQISEKHGRNARKAKKELNSNIVEIQRI